jgi:ABC-type sugar transport system substrate-binding protein
MQSQFPTTRRGRLQVLGASATMIAAMLLMAACSTPSTLAVSASSEAPEESVTLQPFDPNAPAGEAPTDLPKRLGAVLTGTDAFSQSVDEALRAGAEDAGLEYVSAAGDGTEEDMLAKIDTVLNQGVAGLYTFTVNHEAEVPAMRRTLDAGVIGYNVAGYPTTVQINGSQAAAGTKQAEAAIEWIEENLPEGTAKVAYLNNAKVEFLVPRDEAIRAAFEDAGIELVADETPTEQTPEGGYSAMSTILQREPDVNVVVTIGGVASGAVAALEATGKVNPDEVYVSAGNADETELETIAEGSSILQAGLIFPFEPMSYVLGQITADWLAGKSVPMGVTVPGGNLLLSGSEAVNQYREDILDLPGLVESGRISEYVGLWGNTRYEDRAANEWTVNWQQDNV